MVQLTARLDIKSANLLTLDAYTRTIRQAEQDARKASAATATRATRDAFHYLRPIAPPRPGRKSGGEFRNALRWTTSNTPNGAVTFDIAEADRLAPYWIILEVGTGNRATLRQGGARNPQGRPKSGATYVRTVRSQRGRLISSSLGFADAEGGAYTPPSASARNQQLFPRRTLRNAGRGRRTGTRQRGVDQIVIHNEIQPQTFVQKGGTEGFLQYRTSVLAAARRAFAGRGYRP